MNKAVTFDLWGTLIEPNPEYSIKRADFLFSIMRDFPKDSVKTKSLNTIKSTIREIKIKHDNIIETYGVHFASSDLYKQICHSLNVMPGTNYNYAADHIKQCLGDLFVVNPPILMEGTLNILEECKALDLYLISNTVFTDGCYLKKTLHKSDIQKYFKEFIFSDEVGLSKPNPIIFELAKKRMKDNVKILHIGDNPKTDGACRMVEGYEYFKRTETNSKDVINAIKQFANV